MIDVIVIVIVTQSESSVLNFLSAAAVGHHG